MKTAGTADPKSNIFKRRFVRRNEMNLGNRMAVRSPSSSSSSSSKTRREAKRRQLCTRCPCNISLMFMHESPSYNITPQLYAVTIGIVGNSSGAGSMLPPGVHRSISIANNFLFINMIIINFHAHSCNMVTEEKNNGTVDII